MANPSDLSHCVPPSSDALSVIRGLSPGGLEAAGAALRNLASVKTVFSTVFDGPRAPLVDADLAARLDLLDKALGPGVLHRDPLLCDCGSPEAHLLTTIRQLEGHAPYLAAVLTPKDDAHRDEILHEAKAAGVSVSNATGPVGLLPPTSVHAGAGIEGCLKIGACADLEQTVGALEAQRCSAAPLKILSGASPFAAAAHLPGATVTRHDGVNWSVQAPLWPGSVGISMRTWAFTDLAKANDVFCEVARRHRPIAGWTISGLDALIATRAKLWRGHGRYSSAGSGGLFLAFVGPPLERRAAIAEAGWFIERRGGVCHWRQGAPAPALLDAVAVGIGAGRVTSPPQSDRTAVNVAGQQMTWTWQNGQLSKSENLWYIRELSRSLEEAQELMASAEDHPRRTMPEGSTFDLERSEAHG